MRRAFTLIELLVVISIIGVLAGLLLPVFAKVRERAKITTTKGVIGELETALRSYYDDMTEYPFEAAPGSGALDTERPEYSFFYQLTRFGFHAPYTKKGRDSTVETLTSTCLLLKDPWWAGPSGLAGYGVSNHIHYCRGPQRSDASSEDDYKDNHLKKFFGNDATFNLWSFGPNRRDESSDSDKAGGLYETSESVHAGGDEGISPGASEGVGDDITNWNPHSSSFGAK